MQDDPLYKQFDSAKVGGFVSFKQTLPGHITENLAAHIELRPYQVEALNRYVYYSDSYQNRATSNVNLLFNMATGSGKTVIMAALILDLYKRGYNKFVFFVNRSNIVQKTIENFTNPASSKYLFADNISIGGQTPMIRAVEALNSCDTADIQILFTTVQKLHSDLFTPREGRITLEDMVEERIVMLSDEAHHINAWSSGARLSGEEADDKRTWEHGVQKIFKQNQDNILLEFTATIDLANENIKQKYNDVLLYKYDLKQFRNDKYSKEIKLYSVHDDIGQRMLQAVFISQYRLLVAENQGLLLKPVILFKSKRIADSKNNQTLFTKLIYNLSEAVVANALSSSDTLKQLGRYLSDHNVTPSNFIKELKINFDVSRIRNVNDLKEATELQIDINRLEDLDNEIRVIFAVDKLNEGWDVLNLFDIVRLYDTRDGTYTRGGEYKPGTTTTQEAQLIGRGARYWPFEYGQEPKDQRKFDKYLSNELRLIEELYYHSPRDTDYLIEIRTALVESGMMDKKDPATVTLRLKESFKTKSIYKTGQVYVNKLEDNPHIDKKTALDYLTNARQLEVRLQTHSVTTDVAFSEEAVSRIETAVINYKFVDIPRHIVYKALDKHYKFYNFASLKSYLPQLEAKDEFVDMLASINLKVCGAKEEINNLSNENWLIITDNIFSQLQIIIETKDAPKVGSKQFKHEALKDVFKAEKKIIVEGADGSAGKKMSEETDVLYLDLSTREWYAYEEDYGNSYEKRLVKFIDSHVNELKKHWDDLYLIRNERDLRLYSFNDGLSYMPDYLLILNNIGEDAQTYYVFIEPKGENIEVGEKWKEDFLLQLESEAKVERLIEDQSDIKIIGLPFYQPVTAASFEPKNPEFIDAFSVIEKL